MEYENLVLTEQLIKKKYVEREIFEKVGQYSINISRMLIFHIHNGNKIFQDLIEIYRHLLPNNFRQLKLEQHTEQEF